MRYLLFLFVATQAFAKEPLQLPSVGWVENVELLVDKATQGSERIALDAKVDTGAATSSLHAQDIKQLKDKVRFRITIAGKSVWVEAPFIKRGKVKSSDGESEGRLFIEAKVCTGTLRHPILLSLNDRSKMKYPMLLGRDFLKGRFLVDSGKQNLLPKPSCDFQANVGSRPTWISRFP